MGNMTRIHAEVDFDGDGSHTGYLRVPHSVHRSAYGWLPMPVVCINNGPGPSVLLMSGNHGDEYEGQVALCKLVQRLEHRDVHGRLVILPMANYPAARAGLRTSPIDGGNLNRSFPGDPDGTPTQMIAHFIAEVLMPRSDVFIDLHSGGSSLEYLPSVFAELESDGRLAPRVRTLVDAFGAPISQVYRARSDDRMAGATARAKGLTALSTELGGVGTVSPAALRVAEQGLGRVLHALGTLAAASNLQPVPATRYLEVRGDQDYCYCPEDGLFEPLVELGEVVELGQPAASIHFPETPWRPPVTVEFASAGVVVCKRIPARAERGDCLFHLAAEWKG